MQKKILVVTYGGGHARMLRPVIKSMSLNSNLDVQVMALNSAIRELDDLDINLFGYSRFFAEDPEVLKYGQKLINSLEKVFDINETISYLGANFKELVEKYGLLKAESMYDEGKRYIFEPNNIMLDVLKEISPDILITTNSPRSEKSAVLAARRLGIPSVSIIDMFGIRCSSWFSDNDFSDKILVLTNSVKKYLVSLGRNPDSIVVTGNPSFDSLAKHYSDFKSEITQYRNETQFTVLWASQPEPAYLPETGCYGDVELPIKIEKNILKIFDKYNEWKLIVRNHPSETSRSYPEKVEISQQGDDLVELFKKIHVVLTPSSTLGFQGSIMGAKLVTIDCSVLTPTMPFKKMGFSIGVDKIDDIESVLLNLSKSRGSKSEPVYVETHATENVVAEIYDMLNKNFIS